MGSLASYLSTRGFKDGLVKGRRIWAVAGVVVWIGRLIIKMASRPPQIVAREVLTPGQTITITSLERDAN